MDDLHQEKDRGGATLLILLDPETTLDAINHDFPPESTRLDGHQRRCAAEVLFLPAGSSSESCIELPFLNPLAIEPWRATGHRIVPNVI